MTSVPYYAQWESPELIDDILSGRLRPRDDPRWQESGARSAEEYERWARHVCGMACLKMAIAHFTGSVYPIFHLLERAIQHGAYLERDGEIKGMIYAPATQLLREAFGLQATVHTGVEVHELAEYFNGDALFIASVHPGIRTPEVEPPARGGHLVLVTEATQDALRFHNPSGIARASQQDAVLTPGVFARFFAGRGIRLTPS
ncbi:hypothetical protein IEI94_11735 [Halomonas sp. ML-15]|uniref:hypothetical protein n=1 Tax=Halomonas sp. ML-15 TaxID=2773305 RepID=UPI001746A5A6|nr:hypothetical protein [Halomonas sp. ML-15]MBD3896520.1 hypothetical protein [Halomonas sp. ML-15]